ncbi:hypothetical protein ACMGD3_13160 [Lysinibacillus sphaericus]|uniref:hypothetical protein n=1 Tax=Lysinibacillus sphaericus TaxID=1421 RepID=UPI003F793BAA
MADVSARVQVSIAQVSNVIARVQVSAAQVSGFTAQVSVITAQLTRENRSAKGHHLPGTNIYYAMPIVITNEWRDTK